MTNNDQSDLGGNKVTGDAAQRTVGRGGVDSRELPVLDGSPLFHFATIGAATNVAALAAPKAAGESPPPAQPARETQAKETIIDRLRREITEHVAAKRSLKTELEQAAARIADFSVAISERDAALAQGSRTLEELQQASAALESRLGSSAATVEQLTNVVEQNRLAAADAAKLYEEQVAAHTQATERLTLRIRELERDLAQLTDHDSEREAAHEELQVRLARQIATVRQLRSELGNASTSVVEVRAQLAHRQEVLASLERDLVSRDQTIADLEETLLRTRRKMETAQHAGESRLAARVIQLEKTLAERREHDERLQTSRPAADHALRDAEQRIAKLEHQVRGAAKETTKLKEEIAAREELVKHLISSAQLRLDALRIKAPAVRPVDSVSVAPETPCYKMIVAFNGEGRVNYPLRANDMTIGRAPESDIRILRGHVSRTHARIITRGDSTFIEDLGSTNGVFVNYKAIKQRTELHDGDIIGLGDFIDPGAVPELKYIDLHRPATSGRTTGANRRVTPTPHS